MTTQTYTDEEKRIKIAEACGWTRMDCDLNPGASGKNLFTIGSSLQGTPPSDRDKPEDEQAYEKVPDYLNSLDAMHEAEKRFAEASGMIAQYINALTETVRIEHPDPVSNADAVFCLVSATARQRADAFLLTLPEPAKTHLIAD